MDRVNFRQFLLIVFLLAVTMKLFMLPTYMMRISGQDAFIVMLLESGVDMLLLVVVLVIMRMGNGNFFDILTEAFGKIIAKAATIILALFYLAKLFLLLTELRIFFSVSVLYQPLSPLHLLPVLLLLTFISGKQLCAVGRVSEIVTPLVIVSMLVLGLLSFNSVDYSNLLPIASGAANAGKGFVSFQMWFGDFVLLLIFSGRTDGRKRIFFALIAAVAGLFALVMFSSMMFALYSNVPEVLTYGHNISNMTQYSVSSFQYGRFDLLVFCIWLFGVILSAGIMVTFINRCVNFTVGKDIGIWTAITCSAAIIAATYVFFSANMVCEFFINYFAVPAMAVQYGFPLALLAALLTRRIIKRAKAKGVKHEKVRA